MKHISAIFCLLFFGFSTLKAQSDSVRLLQQELAHQQMVLDSILARLERQKLRDIHSEIMDWVLPAPVKDHQVVHHLAFSLSYNEEHEQPDWVAHIVTSDILTGNIARTNDFRRDPMVTTITADSADYWDSGYDRGHMAPSADFRWSRQALSESYYYSNMSPQRPELNREAWADLENRIREWVLDAGSLAIVTGPVLGDGLPEIPHGSMDVSIPEYFYKVVADRSGRRGIAFIMPNGKVERKILTYAVSIDSVEALTGIDFFPSLPDSTEDFIESMSDLAVWPVKPDELPQKPVEINVVAGEISTSQAKYFIGEIATVCGRVVSTKFNQNGKSDPTYLNLDKKFPDQLFTVIIFGKDRVNFPYKPEEYLYNRSVCVTGMVEDWNGVPQIIVSGEEDIRVLED